MEPPACDCHPLAAASPALGRRRATCRCLTTNFAIDGRYRHRSKVAGLVRKAKLWGRKQKQQRRPEVPARRGGCDWALSTQC